MPDGWYWLNTRNACGGVQFGGGVVVDGCPYFRKAFLGKPRASISGVLVKLG